MLGGRTWRGAEVSALRGKGSDGREPCWGIWGGLCGSPPLLDACVLGRLFFPFVNFVMFASISREVFGQDRRLSETAMALEPPCSPSLNNTCGTPSNNWITCPETFRSAESSGVLSNRKVGTFPCLGYEKAESHTRTTSLHRREESQVRTKSYSPSSSSDGVQQSLNLEL